MESIFILLAGLAGLSGVAAGAAGAHGISEAGAHLLDTASRYLLVHAIALFALASLLRQERWQQRAGKTSRVGFLTIAGSLFVIGMFLFGGGLIVHAVTGSQSIAFVVPVGGTTLMAAWLVVAAYGLGLVVRSRRP